MDGLLVRPARFVAAAGLFAPPSLQPVHAQTITVTTTAEAPDASGDCTLGEAIQAANSAMAVDACPAGNGFDAIVLAPGATLTHVTVASKTANSLGGGLASSRLGSVVSLRNSLVAYNAGGNCNASSIAAAGGKLQYPGNTRGVATLGDPLLRQVPDNGGHTLTAALGPGSPALDAGSSAYCPPTDQRGRPRPAGPGCDLGAYERWFDLFLPLLRR